MTRTERNDAWQRVAAACGRDNVALSITLTGLITLAYAVPAPLCALIAVAQIDGGALASRYSASRVRGTLAPSFDVP